MKRKTKARRPERNEQSTEAIVDTRRTLSDDKGPDPLCDETQALLDRIARRAPGYHVELFVRETTRRRVTCERHRKGLRICEGTERGVGLRLLTSDGRSEGFAATSLARPDPSDWLTDRAMASVSSRQGPPVGLGGPGELLDLADTGALPEVDSMAAWVEKGLDGLIGAEERTAARAAGWLECATTVEVLVNGTPLRAVRRRDRAWAMATVSRPGAVRGQEALFEFAARPFSGLRLATWTRQPGPVPSVPSGDRRSLDLPLVLEPGPSARLVSFLTRALQGVAGTEVEVGTGWRIEDDPRHPDAFIGGTFDDAGFATARRTIADGMRALPLSGPGTFRRESYRDRPHPLPTRLVVAATPVAPPDNAIRVTALRVIGLPDGSCLLDLEGFLVCKGEPAVRVEGGRVRANPATLVRACVGSVGQPEATGWAVITPGLVLEGLRAEV